MPGSSTDSTPSARRLLHQRDRAQSSTRPASRGDRTVSSTGSYSMVSRGAVAAVPPPSGTGTTQSSGGGV